MYLRFGNRTVSVEWVERFSNGSNPKGDGMISNKKGWGPCEPLRLFMTIMVLFIFVLCDYCLSLINHHLATSHITRVILYRADDISVSKFGMCAINVRRSAILYTKSNNTTVHTNWNRTCKLHLSCSGNDETIGVLMLGLHVNLIRIPHTTSHQNKHDKWSGQQSYIISTHWMTSALFSILITRSRGARWLSGYYLSAQYSVQN